LGIKIPTALVVLTAVGVAAGVALGLSTREQPAEQHQPATDDQGQAQASLSTKDQASSQLSEHAEATEPLRAREVGGNAFPQ
jgi:hypothetical protein